ncbi:MAG: AAA family ATPase [Pseudonocardiaceae bacterium]
MSIDEKVFPEERWLIVYVPQESLTAAQSLAGQIEQILNSNYERDGAQFAVTFRSSQPSGEAEVEQAKIGGRLSKRDVDQLIQLLEARSRTSDALPSLGYVEDPRASLAAVGASRHQLIYGRRGVGKTALLVESKRLAERDGHITVWINAHVVKGFDPNEAFLFLTERILDAILKTAGSSRSAAFAGLQSSLDEIRELRRKDGVAERNISHLVADLNTILRSVLRRDLLQLVVYIDDFYLYPSVAQPQLLDLSAGLLRDCNGWLKLASIERLTRPYEPSSRIGLEIPHDATKIDLDVTLEDPAAAQSFLETVLSHYTATAGLPSPASIAKVEALGRLVLASGGVPRDYLNLFGDSIVVARENRSQAREIGKEDVAAAAGRSSRSKKRDLDLDVSSEESVTLLDAISRVSDSIKGAGFTYFRVNSAEKMLAGYEILSRLVDMRFIHLIQSTLSDKHSPGMKYEAYVLALSEYTDIRLKRGLQVLDLEAGRWTHRQSGKANTVQQLIGTQLRDRLRQAPLIDLRKLERGGPQLVLASKIADH